MKIVVDGLPSNPNECRYSVYTQTIGDKDVFKCKSSAVICRVEKENWKCPIYIPLKEAIKRL